VSHRSGEARRQACGGAVEYGPLFQTARLVGDRPADGTFTINDVPRARREVTYTVGRPGDDLHNGATASAEVYVRR
jgi:hypothetical protein